ncbi:MAG: DNA-directed RNA polymerase subunit alpha C-terminal domain-containing protein [Planctomycetota bacterium]
MPEGTLPLSINRSVLSARAVNALRRLAVTTIEDLANLCEAQLAVLPNCGMHTIAEIVRWRRSQLQVIRPPTRLDAPLPAILWLEVSSALRLTTRAQNLLLRLGASLVGDLVTLQPDDLREVRGCGVGVVRELEDAADSLGLALGMVVPEWQSRRDEPLSRRRTVELAAEQTRLTDERFAAIDSSTTVESEIESALTLLCGPEDAERIGLWLGMDGSAKPTLQSVGDATGVTREAVRQVVTRARTAVAGAASAMPLMRRAIERIESGGLQSDAMAEASLVRDRLCDGRMEPQLLLRAAEFFEVPCNLSRTRFGNRWFVGNEDDFASLRIMRGAATYANVMYGCTTVAHVSDRLQQPHNGGCTASDELLRNVLDSLPSFHWLDEGDGWFWLDQPTKPRGTVLIAIDKIMAVAPRVKLAHIHAGIVRAIAKTEHPAPPLNVVRELCRQLPDCNVSRADVVTTSRRPRAKDVLTPTELSLLEAFRARGPVLTYVQAKRLCEAAGIGAASAGAAVNRAPFVVQLGRGRYALVGTRRRQVTS